MGLPGKLTLALLLVGAGVLLGLKNFHFITEDFWRASWKLWPLLLIFFGVELLLSRGKGGKR